jgi:hypothetical protein
MNRLLIGLALLFLCSCAAQNTYKAKTSNVETNLFDGDFKVAIANIDQNQFLQKERNKLLYYLEKGKVEHLAGNYEKSNEYFELAYMMIDDKIKTNFGQGVAAKLTNPMAAPYKGEDFEKVTLHYYKALNFFHLGKPDDALVEAKRINIKLLALNDKYTKNKNKYSADAFSQIIQGILYEAVGDVNNAFIAYRNAAEIYSANGNQYFGVPMPEQLKRDLIRTSAKLGFTAEMKAYQKAFNMAPAVTAKSVVKKPVKSTRGAKAPVAKAAAPKTPVVIGELIVFWENGLGPVKGQTKITASGMTGGSVGSYSDEENDIFIPVPVGVNIGLNAIAIPKYIARDSYYSRASVIVNNNEHYFELSQDFNQIAKQCLKDRMLREAIDIALRFGSKKAVSKGLGLLAQNYLGSTAGTLTSLAADGVNMATEKADTRNWQTLPATISYLRIPLKEGLNTFALKKYGVNGINEDSFQVTGKPGLQVMSYSDLGRIVTK